MRQKIVAAVDLGSSKTCSVLANVDVEGNVQVLGIGTCISRGIQKGQVVDIDEAAVSLREAVRKAEQIGGERIGSIHLGVSGGSVSSTSNRSVVATGKSARSVSEKDVKRALTVARQSEAKDERRLLHMIPTNYTLDGQLGVREPVGMHGFRLDVDTHIVTIPEGSAENIMKCVRKAGLDVESLVLDCLASAQSVLYSDEIDTGVVIADIGAGTTGVAAYKNGGLVLTSVLPVGGNQITKDLAVGLGVHFDVAEQLKKEHCDISYRTTRSDSDDAETEPLTVNLDGVGRIAVQDINDIVRARVSEILKLVLIQLSSQRPSSAEFPAGLVLTGGSANLHGIEQIAQEVTGLPTRIGVPRGLSGVADVLYDPAYASTVGILLCGGKWRQDQKWIRPGLMGRIGDNLKNVSHNVPRIKLVRGA